MSESDEIPEDIRRAAQMAVFEFETRVQSGEFSEPDGFAFRASMALSFTIERAILAERERCARIAESPHTFRTADGEVLFEGPLPTGVAVAEAIRKAPAP